MDNDVYFPFYLRVPGWCENATIAINCRELDPRANGGSYILIDRKWSDGDEVVLNLPMDIGLRTWQVNQNSVSVDYGPLTFSLKIEEDYNQLNSTQTAIWDSKWQDDANPEKWPSFEIMPTSDWNYGLIVDKNDLSSSFSVRKKEWPEDNYPFSVANAPIEIQAHGKRIPSWQIDQYGLVDVLPRYPAETNQPAEDITLVPMGCARLRISAFPVVQ